jgi:cyclopropane-fatty-acyl-phospholipid synthase
VTAPTTTRTGRLGRFSGGVRRDGGATSIAGLVDTVAGPLPFRVVAYDGSAAGPPDAPLTLRVTSPDALRRALARPGELGLARAYVAGDVELVGDVYAALGLGRPRWWRPEALRALVALVRELGPSVLTTPAPPTIEARPRGRLHSRGRDAASVTYHYDVSNRFYELVLGPSMVYSCAVFESPDEPLEVAQLRKVDLVCQKLGLDEGMRLLDVGCGWGTLAIHAARTYGCRVVGITLSAPQQFLATARARDAGVAHLVEFRRQDYRDVHDRPFDAISSIGMSEHVGRKALDAYASCMFELVRPGGRLLNHAIGRPGVRDGAPARSPLVVRARRSPPSRIGSTFIRRYVFPDGELHEVGTVVSLLQRHGLEVRHLESLREHYGLTLRRWVANLEAAFDEARDEVGEARARVWRLYMAGSAVGFERHRLEVHQALCVRPERGRSHLALRPAFPATVDASWLPGVAQPLASSPRR